MIRDDIMMAAEQAAAKYEKDRTSTHRAALFLALERQMEAFRLADRAYNWALATVTNYDVGHRTPSEILTKAEESGIWVEVVDELKIVVDRGSCRCNEILHAAHMRLHALKAE